MFICLFSCVWRCFSSFTPRLCSTTRRDATCRMAIHETNRRVLHAVLGEACMTVPEEFLERCGDASRCTGVGDSEDLYGKEAGCDEWVSGTASFAPCLRLLVELTCSCAVVGDSPPPFFFVGLEESTHGGFQHFIYWPYLNYAAIQIETLLIVARVLSIWSVFVVFVVCHVVTFAFSYLWVMSSSLLSYYSWSPCGRFGHFRHSLLFSFVLSLPIAFATVVTLQACWPRKAGRRAWVPAARWRP